MSITDVVWVRDHQHRLVLRLNIDGHPAHFPSKQKVELLRRGMVKGIDFFASEWRGQGGHAFIQGAIEPGLGEKDLEGCTDDPQVFALHEEMCRAIAAGAWQPGARAAFV